MGRIGYDKHNDSKIPYSVLFAITEKCDARCPGCFAAKFGEWDSDLAIGREIIDILSDSGVKRISFGGGEPTLHSKILDFIRYAHDKKLCTAMSTNGIKLVNNEMKLKNFDGILDEIIINYHSTNASISMKFAPWMDREHIEKIEALFAQIVALGTLQLKAATVMFQANANYQNLQATAEKLKTLGVKIWKIDQYYNVDKPESIRKKFLIEDSLYNKLISEIKESSPAIKVIGVGAEFKRNQRNFMISPRGNAFVNYEGKSIILGSFVRNNKELFRRYHSPLPVENYTILHKKV